MGATYSHVPITGTPNLETATVMAFIQQMDLALSVPSYVLLAALAVIIVLFTVVAIIARMVLAKARPEDLPHVLPALGQVMEALALFLPWGRGSRDPAEVASSARRDRRARRPQC
ncbi:hypothetical protein SLA_2060 [Streptomyces laurentii]|uniref:Uncharacterized protein n=1 Tax=Streptomyces laurentii TaxID=39478 RepID=A0A160NWA0_STRLU|nr:hypothetical protein SLA_2060 [Streptomyces laurentii]